MSASGSGAEIRRFRADDLAAARRLLDEGSRTGGRECQRLAEILEAVSDAGEYRGSVAIDGSEMVGLALYGPIAGTVRTGALHGILVRAIARRQGVGSALLADVCDALASSDPVVAEVRADPRTDSYEGFLKRRGFSESGRVADFYGDDEQLVILALRRGAQ